MENYKPYTKYKPSGIAWLGDIPEHWDVESFKNILTERNEKNNPIRSIERLSLSIDKGVTLYAEKTTNLDRFKDDFTQYKLAYKGDLVFNSMNMIVGAVGVSQYFGCVSPVYYTYHGGPNNSYTSKFYEYLFTCKTIQGFLYSLGRGLMAIDRGEGKYNTLRLKVSRGDLRSMRLPFPNLHEQSAIVAFLDFKLAKINRFIRKKKQLIKLLNEQKAAIINHAVTKGIDPNAKMKPSGIEWLGEIPEHWEVKPLKYICYLQRGHDLSKDNFIEGKYPVYGSNGKIGFHNEMTTKAPCITVGRSGSVGEVNLVNEDFWAHNTSLYVIRSFGNNWEYLYFLLKNVDIKMVSNGSAVPTLDRKNLHELFVPHAPIPEQEFIVQYIAQQTNTINQTISTIEKEIALTQEYKTALIAEAVTGKIDVRDFEIPETLEEECCEELEEELSIAAEDEAEYDILEKN